ncbi:YgiW/YdeI family stress tolerance OB fold protein [Roseibium sp. SCP14]|uniref:YgiW/YdeI family stress tolerance OB fold protein n=1 Tax=Roseibium sp. SCP14 TaxID=3141375 RepID=UPI0033391681
MKTWLMICATFAAPLVLVSPSALAGHDHGDGHDQTSILYTGPADIVKVSNLPSRGGLFADDEIIVEGKLIKQVDDETFLFDDGSGQILLEVDRDISNLTVSDTDNVRVFGRYDGFWGEPSIEAESIKVLKP